MLKDDVVEAVRRREFVIHAVSSVDQTVELLTGQKADDVNRLAVAKLQQMAKHAERKP